MQILPNCLYVVAHGSSKTTVCVEGMYKSCVALTLHTGFLSKPFAIKSCRNPARHIFSWLPREAVSLHTGVLTKTFAIKICTNPARHIFPWLPGEAVDLHTGVLTKTFAIEIQY